MTRITDIFHADVFTYLISRWMLLRMKTALHNSRKKSKHVFYVQYFVSENGVIYERMSKNMVEPGRLYMTV